MTPQNKVIHPFDYIFGFMITHVKCHYSGYNYEHDVISMIKGNIFCLQQDLHKEQD